MVKETDCVLQWQKAHLRGKVDRRNSSKVQSFVGCVGKPAAGGVSWYFVKLKRGTIRRNAVLIEKVF